ncbi:hypothetical protein SteCoe_935 [Stentor coeruleus]|uniref:C2H2-type domain-containing protein n=1 Tax=Stentor coeruleus TaxID=5963 RepID=A0A1R2D340_9CILI|nr:hypothetical protein SteCoe_935 [Stentor coeruleus]
MNSQRIICDETQSLPPAKTLSIVISPSKINYPTCPHCEMMFVKEFDLNTHLNIEQSDQCINSNSQVGLACKECCLSFDSSKDYMKHHAKVHENKYEYSKCPQCPKKFKNKHAARFHIKQVHHKVTRENCPSCGKEFYSKYLIPKHLLKCSKGKLKNFKMSLDN